MHNGTRTGHSRRTAFDCDKWDLSQGDRNFFFPIIFHLNVMRSFAAADTRLSCETGRSLSSPSPVVSLTDGNRFLIASPSLPNTVTRQLAVHTMQLSTSGLDFAKGPFPRRPLCYRNTATTPLKHSLLFGSTMRHRARFVNLIQICGRITTDGHFRILQNHGCFRVCNARNSIQHSMRMITFISGIERWFPEDARAKILSVVATCNVIT